MFDLEECLQLLKHDITSIVFYAKSKQKKEVQDRKGKQMEAITILKSKLIDFVCYWNKNKNNNKNNPQQI